MAGQLQFWGVEVKAKVPCQVEVGSFIHISQATLGEIKKDDETVTVYVKVGEKKLVLAMLSKKTPQTTMDLVFDEDFEISHNWKNGSIHLMGYVNESPEFESDDSSDEEFEDAFPIAKENGQLAAPAATKPKAAVKSKPEVERESDDDSSDGEFGVDGSEDSDSEEDDSTDSEGSEEPEDESDDSEEETPAKVVDAGKKRPNADADTPLKSKKAKLATPQKTDGKKVDQPTTPVSSKKAGKTPAGDKTPKSPKSGGSDVSCGSCKKTFKSGGALESHNKAKHGAN